jgi:hypothetical protein
MRTSRGFFAAINVDEIIYCIGGSDGSVISTVEAYDTLNNSWSTKTSIPKKVRNAGIFTLNGKIYCIGGKIDNSDSESDKRNTVSVYTAKIVSDEEVAEYYVELAEKYQTEEYIQYALSFTEILSESTKKSELIRRIEILIYEPESKNISNDVFIIPDNILEVSSNINSIIFDNFSVLESCEKLSVLELTVSSSLPYNIKSSIESDIFGSNSGNKIDKSILSIKTSKDNTYKDFSESITVLTLAENQSIGENIKHTIDIRLNAGKIKKMDIYKTILKFEIEQL